MGGDGLLLKGPVRFQVLVLIVLSWKDPRRKSVPVSRHPAGTVEPARRWP